MKREVKFWMKAVIFVFCILTISGFYVYSQTSQYIKYLPSDEDMISIEKNYTSKMLREVPCQAAKDYFQRASDCDNCMALKVACSDCCLDFEDGAASRCTAEADSKYDCKPYAFSSDSCSDVRCWGDLMDDCSASRINLIPHCQKKGCPSDSFEPRSHGWRRCYGFSGTWYCNDDNLIPEDRGCRPRVSIPGYKSKFHSSGDADDYYDISGSSYCRRVRRGTGPEGNPIYQNVCYSYKYEPADDYRRYVENCRNYTDSTERCNKAKDCCNMSVCPDSPIGAGFDVNCNEGVCEQRRDYDTKVEVTSGVEKGCNELSAGDCAYLHSLAEQCLLDVGSGSCGECFPQIDEDFYYKFVARSGESIVVFWQVVAEPMITGNPETYFYTLVKVVDENGAPVHQSVAHQKAFQGAFSIFSATAINAASGILEQGKSYYIRLYYFIPEIENSSLNMDVKYTQLIVVRTRE